MLIMMISEMPLPMPRAVIWSPSHMTNMAAVVMAMTVMMTKPKPGLETICPTFARKIASGCDCRVCARTKLWQTQMMIVK